MEYSSLREILNVPSLNGHSEHYAFITHFLQNRENEQVARLFREKAFSALAGIREDKESDSIVDADLLADIAWDVPFPAPENPEFTFIDLFAGIGGFRIPLQNLGGKCVFTSEFNPHAQRAYEMNFGEVPFGDITSLDLDMVPDHNILCAGFPCQPFSISGRLKGFEDTRGTLIYHVFEIIERRRPEVVFLENVKHLLYHDERRTLKVILMHLRELGYVPSVEVLNASDFGVPQNRERLIIIAHRDKEFNFSKINKQPRPILRDFLEEEGEFEYLDEPYTILDEMTRQKSGLIFAGYRNKAIRKAGVRPGTIHLSRVHKQPNRIYSIDGVHPALPSQESSGRFWIYDNEEVRKLTIKECYRIMGFPDEYRFIESKAELYKQIGNSVAVPMIQAVAQQIIVQLLDN